MKDFFSKNKTYIGFFLAFIAIEFFIFSSITEEEKHANLFLEKYNTFSIPIPDSLSFSGEKVPFELFNVKEAFDKELTLNTYWQSQTLMMHKLSNRWFPLIEQILKKNNVPDDFKYLVLVESGLNNVVSPAGATGYWQLIESTAKIYGLEINAEVDERYNLKKSTQAACDYFKYAYKQLGNWTLVAASYNLGIGGIAKQLEKQKVNSFYELHLNEETSRYIYRILAFKEVISNPSKYGYKIRKKDLYPFIPTKQVIIDSAITNLVDFSFSQGINFKTLKYFNPWLRKNFLSNKEKKKYSIEIPKNNIDSTFLSSLINLDKDSVKYLYTFANTIPQTDSLTNKKIHLVKPGEDIQSISKMYTVDENLLKSWNKISEKDKLKPDQEIIIFQEK